MDQTRRETDPHTLSRRDFIGAAAGAVGVAALGSRAMAQDEPKPLLKRPLGKTGYEATIMGIGIGALGDGRLPEETVLEVVNAALDEGVNYLDTAPTYGNTQAFVGPLVAERRDEMFLTTKVRPSPDKAAARAILEKSLTDLRTDVVDLAYIHNLGDFDLDQLESPEGVLTMLREAKDEGLVRHIGVSGHHTPSKFPELYKRAPDLEVTMVPVNIVDRHTYSFDSTVIPAAIEHDLAVIAMKTLGGVTSWQYGPGKAKLGGTDLYSKSIRYALGHEGVVTGIVGFCTLDELRQGLQVARDFEPLSEDELAEVDAASKEFAEAWGLHYGPST